MNEYDSAVTGLDEAPLRGILRVTAPFPFGRRHVAPLVVGFLKAFPEMQVELVLNDGNLDFIEHRLDVAVRIGFLEDSPVKARCVGEVRRILVASPAYLAARGIPKKPADLAVHDTILGTSRSQPSEWRFGPPKHRSVVRLSPRLLVNDLETRLVAARAGQGIAQVLSYQVSEDLEAGALVRILSGFETAPLPIHLVSQGSGYKAPKVKAFLDYAAGSLAALPVIRSMDKS